MRYFALSLLAMLSFSLVANGQSFFNQQTTNTGTFGSRTLGGGIGGSNSTQFGSPGSRTTQGQEAVGQLSGNERFVRDARQPGQFVGGDSGDAGNPFSQMQGGGNLRSAIDSLRGQQQQGQPRGQRDESTPVRLRLSVGFTPSRVAPSRLSTTLTGRLARIAQLQKVTPLAAEVRQGVVRLTGIVPSEHDRDLAARLVLLEPGVSGVQNDLVVQSAETLPPGLPVDPFDADPAR